MLRVTIHAQSYGSLGTTEGPRNQLFFLYRGNEISKKSGLHPTLYELANLKVIPNLIGDLGRHSTVH